jgi:4-amino-4-deoxychorismate lyase
MCQLLETIKVRQNSLQHVEFHNERVNYSRSYLFESIDNWDLLKLISVPGLDPGRIYRCRFLYSRVVEKIEFLPYAPRIIQKLFFVTVEDLDYSFKYANRDAIDRLKSTYATEPNSDILIVKNGLVTDTSFSNIVFYDGSNWYTPDSPLLKGTKRAWYLQQGILLEKKITLADIPKYQKARLINAMMDLVDGDDIAIKDIII